MATIERLTKRPDFLAAAEGRRFHTERMSAQGRLRTSDGPPGLRLGFTITKRVGHATERNRIRRRLRAAVTLVAANLPGDLAILSADIVLIARRPALDAPFETLAEDLRRALPAVTRPATPRPPGQGRGKRSSSKSSSSTSGDRTSKTTPLPREAGQAAPTGQADIGPSYGRGRGPRITGARGSDATGARPDVTPNACGGVPDGQ